MAIPSFSRNILVAVTGLSPQIITETLFALAVDRELPLVPDEIHVLTTAEGAEQVKLSLLSTDPGWFHRLRADYQLPPIHFDEHSIHILRDKQGAPLDDVRTPEDNEQLADFIAAKIRELTNDPDSALHVSIAGGRKTMGFYLGYALSLFGRPQDRLSHVLVSSAFESNPKFFYPTPREHVIHDRNGRPLDAAKAKVTLAEIPFVRLRANLPKRMRDHSFHFAEVVDAAQAWERPPRLELDLQQRQLVAGGDAVRLTPVQFAVFSWLALRAAQQQEPINPIDDGMAEEFLESYRSFINDMNGLFERTEKMLQAGMKAEWFRTHSSNINKRLRNFLGETTAEPYLIHSIGSRPYTRYAITLEPGEIEIS